MAVARRLPQLVLGGGCLFFWAGLVAWRAVPELQHEEQSNRSQVSIGSHWDPRGFERVDQLVHTRESESFKARLRSGRTQSFGWPGLQSAQVSWAWLELLQGLHNEASYQGDFSWMFSKLNTVVQNSPKKEVYFVTMLGAFFYAIGRDFPGANILLQETIQRAGDRYNPWFWGGYHAYYNLKAPNLAGDMFKHAAKFPYAPPYVAVLAARMSLGEDLLNSQEKQEILEKELEPDLIEKIKRARADWFTK